MTPRRRRMGPPTPRGPEMTERNIEAKASAKKKEGQRGICWVLERGG